MSARDREGAPGWVGAGIHREVGYSDSLKGKPRLHELRLHGTGYK